MPFSVKSAWFISRQQFNPNDVKRKNKVPTSPEASTCMCEMKIWYRSLRVSFTLRLGTTGSEKEQGCIENHEGVMHTYTRTHSGTVPWSSRVHCSVGHQSCRTHVQRGRDEDSACNLRPNRYSPPKSLRQDFKTRVVYDGP